METSDRRVEGGPGAGVASAHLRPARRPADTAAVIMDNVVMPTPRVLALRAARAAPPKRRPRAQRAAGGRGRGCVGSHSNWVSRIGSVALTRNAGVHCICSSPGWGPGVAKGARSAPRPTMQRTGATRSASGLDEKLGVSRILRLGGKARAPPRRGATLSRLHVPAIRRQILRERALAMRAAPTSSEEALWRLLRARQLGVRFRRQVPLGRFIADFVAPSARLAIEVDGGYQRRARTLMRVGSTRWSASVIACCGCPPTWCSSIRRRLWSRFVRRWGSKRWPRDRSLLAGPGTPPVLTAEVSMETSDRPAKGAPSQ